MENYFKPQFWSHTYTFHFCFRHLKNATLAWMMILIHDWWPSIITEAFQLSYLWPQNGLGRRTCQHICRASKTRLQESTSQNGCDTNKGRYFDYCKWMSQSRSTSLIIELFQNYLSQSSLEALIICFRFVTKLRSGPRSPRNA